MTIQDAQNLGIGDRVLWAYREATIIGINDKSARVSFSDGVIGTFKFYNMGAFQLTFKVTKADPTSAEITNKDTKP